MTARPRSKSSAYQSLTPTANLILKQRLDRMYYDTHRKKVESAKPKIDTRPPEAYAHLHLRLKKKQMEADRYAIIQRDNRILLEKISSILRTKGRLDNRNDHPIKRRQQEYLRVTQENQAILKRIECKKPCYNRRKLEYDWNINQGYMRSISKYYHTWKYKKQQPKQLPVLPISKKGQFNSKKTFFPTSDKLKARETKVQNNTEASGELTPPVADQPVDSRSASTEHSYTTALNQPVDSRSASTEHSYTTALDDV